jgi:hypothetical protein
MSAKSDTEYEENLERLRRLYVEATPRQRLHIAKQRIQNPDHGPNQLVTAVAAVEGFARSLTMHCHADSKAGLSEIYPKYRFKGPEDLIEEFLKASNRGTPSSLFATEDWRLFKFAVQYRNVLTHECTYLGQDTFPELLSACYRVLSALAATQNISFDAEA